jgi:outer membrane receptor protein involved in Fe transport
MVRRRSRIDTAQSGRSITAAHAAPTARTGSSKIGGSRYLTHSARALTLCGLVCIAGTWPLAASASDAGASSSASNPATASELPQVIVIGNAPLPGLGLPMNQIPANVQTADSRDMQRQQTLDLADYLNNNFTGVSISASADNPLQLDVYYHGFTASPLLGTPEGLSVYVDGVRVNESFGDTVNWDLIPESAISTVTLMSGSNPVFGLNTLGGALSVQTKSGHNNPGSELEGYGGSFGRRSFQAQTGGEVGRFDYFVTGNYFDESGWRDVSPTTVYQGFGKVGWQNERTDIDLSYSYADTSLYGNGAVPLSMLYVRRETSYTPDFTQNLLHFVNLTGTQFVSEHLLLSGNAYYRHLSTGSSNGSVNDNFNAASYPGPPIDCTAAPSSRAEIAFCANGVKQLSRLLQRTAGVGVQLTDSQDVLGWSNQGILGADYEDSQDQFAQMFAYGTLAADRSLIRTINPLNNETVISLGGSNRIVGVYLTDTLSPSKLLHLTASARYNSNTEKLNGSRVDTDVGDVGSGFDQASALVGSHTFSRLNPALGFTVTPTNALTLYADYNEASRAPTVIELGCSNPAAPCGLPNDFASDPELSQVVARTVEAGIRGNLADQRLTWSADIFHTRNSNDIQFIAAGTNQGYFNNVGATRRQGLDLALGGKQGGLSWHLAYSLVDATYQSGFQVRAESNSTADANGNIRVRPGDRIPLTPRHTGRLVLDYQLNKQLDIGANLVAASGAFLHGNENNANQPGGTNGEGILISPTGTGRLPSYVVINLQGTYHVSKQAEVFARLVNLMNKEYATAGFLTKNSFNPNGSYRSNPGDWTQENAVSPAPPRGIWAGVRIHFN